MIFEQKTDSDVFLTKELFLFDSYLKNCNARVVEVTGEKFVVFDQTVFFPKGGGQPCDIGQIKHNGKTLNVLSVKRENGKILHEIEQNEFLPNENLSVGSEVECEIDWPARYALMQMHSSAHVLSQVIFLETCSLSAGNQLGVLQSRMDFNVKEFSKEMAQGFIDKANKVIARGLEITIEFMKRETALVRPELFKLKDVGPKNLPELRIVSIGDFDMQADGGTHVKNTKEIGKLKLMKTENKGKENRRIYWQLE